MKLGKILTVVLLLILLTGVAYGIYTLGYPYLEKYLQAQKGPIDKGTPPEETIVAVAIDRASSGNLYSGEGGNVYFQFYENEIDWDSMRIAITYGDDKVQTISLTEDMLSEEDLESLERRRQFVYSGYRRRSGYYHNQNYSSHPRDYLHRQL